MAAASNPWAKLDKTKLSGWTLADNSTPEPRVAVVNMRNLPLQLNINGYTWRRTDFASRWGTYSYFAVNVAGHYTVSPERDAQCNPTKRIENFHWTYHQGTDTYHYRFARGSGSLGGTWSVNVVHQDGSHNNVLSYDSGKMLIVKVFVSALGYRCEIAPAQPVANASTISPPASSASSSASST